MEVKLIREWAKSENGRVSKARGVHLRHLGGNDRNKHRHLHGANYSFVVHEVEGKLLSVSGPTGHWVMSVGNSA
jgi:hypothetical protein